MRGDRKKDGFCLPFWAVNEALPIVWSAIRAMEPLEVEEKGKSEAGPINRKGSAFRAGE